MNSLQLLPTEENLYNTYIDNAIGRNKDINSFVDILYDVNGQMSICVDGQWGSGKTFFVKQTKLILDAMNSVNKVMAEEKKSKIQHIFAKDKKSDEQKEYGSQFAVYYDAWENDNDTDPLLSIIYEIVKSADCMEPVTEDVSFIKIAMSIVEMVKGVDISKLFEQFTKNEILNGVKNQKSIAEAINDFLSSVIEERGDRLVIFIDELDRCKPSYAISLLERIKHYFNNDNVTFVFSINSVELTKTIKKFYGSDFSAQAYLDRFFDFSLALPDIDITKFYSYNKQYLDIQGDAIDAVSHFVIRKLNLSMRATANYLNTLSTVGLKNEYEKLRGSYSFEDDLTRGRYFCVGFFAPIMIGLYLYDREQYNQFITCKDSSILVEAMDDVDVSGGYYYDQLLCRGESYSDEPEATTVTKADKVAEVCRLLFKDSFSDNNRKRVGNVCFSKGTRTYLFRITSILNKQ